MRVAVFGASGPTGQHLVRQSLDQGHTVVALVRTPSKIDMADERLRVVTGDVLDPGAVGRALDGVDAVLSALGVGRSFAATTVYSQGGRTIVEAMQRRGIRRFVGVGSGGVEHDDPSLGWVNRAIVRPLLLQRAYSDMARFERYLRDSTIEWIFVRPTKLTNGPLTGRYRVSPRFAPQGGTEISRADLAHFMIEQLTGDAHLRQTPTLAY